MPHPELTEEFIIRCVVSNKKGERDFITQVVRDRDKYFVNMWMYPSMDPTKTGNLKGYDTIDEAYKIAIKIAENELESRLIEKTP